MEYGKKYHNCLRLQITVDNNSDNRISAAVEHCKKFCFDNVMLMFNGEEFNLGHITKEESREWIETLKKAKREFENAGISVSLNYWIEIGHVGRGRKLKSGQNFLTYTGMNGLGDGFVACPLDNNWRAYFLDFVRYAVSELKPDTFWIEDDFRLHNHPPAVGVGCFCDNHMRLYNGLLGTNYTREEFVGKVYAKGGLNGERKVFLDANKEVMLETARLITTAVKEACPDTEVALMSSAPDVHCLEARDWHRLSDIISCGGNKIHRIHLPCYEEQSGKDYMYGFNSVSMGVRALCPSDIVVMPEMENGPPSMYRKSPRFMQFVLEAAIPLVLSGMTYSLYGFEGNGPRDSFGYGQAVKDLQPYMQSIMDLELRFDTLRGVVVPICGNASYLKSVENDYRDLMPTEFNAAAYLSGLGIAYKYSEEKNIKGQTVFLTGGSADYFDDGELKNLFRNNYIILDGSAVLKLKDRGMLSLINAVSAELKPAESGYQTYEEYCGKDLIDGIANMRASCRLAAGDFVKIEYYGESTDVFSKAYNEEMKPLSACAVKNKNFAVLPFVIDKKLFSLFCDLRKYFVSGVISDNSRVCAVCDCCGVSPYLFSDKEKSVLILINSNTDNFDNIAFTLKGVEFNEISEIKKNGTVKKVSFTRKNDRRITIDSPLEYLSSSVFILK